MGYVRQYDSGVVWENAPSTSTPINRTNLNQMDNAIINVDAEAKRAIDAVEASIATVATVDSTTSTTSEHPLQNKVITNTIRNGYYLRCKEGTVNSSQAYISVTMGISADYTGFWGVSISDNYNAPAGGLWSLRIGQVGYACVDSDGNPFGSVLTKDTIIIFEIDAGNYRAIVHGIIGGVTSVEHGGTGNTDGYIRIGVRSGTTIGEYSTAEGNLNTSSAIASHAEGYDNIASRHSAHAEGRGNTASGDYSHAEGHNNTASGYSAHAEGDGNAVSGNYSHAEGSGNTVSGLYAYASGEDNTADGSYAFVAGHDNVAHSGQTVFGHNNASASGGIFFVGNGSDNSHRSNALEVYNNGNVVAGGTITDGSGNSITAVEANPQASASASLTKLKVGSTIYGISGGGSGSTVTITPTLDTGTKIADYTIDSVAGELYAPSGGGGGLPSDPLSIDHGGTGNSVGYIQTGLASGYTAGTKATSEGAFTAAEGDYSHSEGYQTNASGDSAHTEGYQTIASANFAHAEGNYTKASGIASHAEGRGTEQDSQYEYIYTEASGDYAHAEGRSSIASGDSAHAEGKLANATGDFSHAEGQENTASNTAAHAEGYLNTASGVQAHAEGARNTASGAQAHAGGRYNVAGYAQQTVIGRFNDNKSTTLFEVGNGTATNARSNAFEVLANGDIQAYGHITDGYGHVLGSSSETISYQIVTKDTSGSSAAVTVKKYVNGVLDSSTDYLYEALETPVNIDGYLSLVYGSEPYSYTYTLLQTSDDHATGYNYSWAYDATVDITEDFTVGGGGTEVEANPSGTATADLTKIKIEDTIYNVGAGLSTAQLNALLALI